MKLANVGKSGAPALVDHDDLKASQWIAAWDGAAEFDLALLGAPLSKTSISHSGAFRFPETVRQALSAYGTYHMDRDVDIASVLTCADLGDIQMHVTDLVKCHTNIREATADFWAHERTSRLMLIGGDHSITAPAFSSFVEVMGRPCGVIHFDAHHDMRNLTDGGATNGTPFRTLIETGFLDPSRLVQIGLRNFVNSKPYTDFAKAHGVTLVTQRQLNQSHLERVLNDALAVAGRNQAPVYLSFDLDVIDPAFAPGVPAPAPGGMTIWQALDIMEWAGEQVQIRAIDWVCADPTQDVRNLTSRVAAQMMLSYAVGVAAAKNVRENDD